MRQKTLKKARKNKNDEFYTRYEDVKTELDNYKDKFKDKVILCNCNDKGSAFERYFTENDLGIKELVVTEGRFQDNLKALERCDIVVTNPPFSQFIEFIDLLVEYNKDFIVWGNNTNSSYKTIFKNIINNKMFYGHLRNKTCTFNVPKEYHESGECKVPACSVFTTFDIIDVPPLELVEYNESKYEKFDNFDAINVGKIKDIPDYDGYMGVPITFLNRWNKDQFEIVEGMNRYGILDLFGNNEYCRKNRIQMVDVNGKPKFFRVVIKKK